MNLLGSLSLKSGASITPQAGLAPVTGQSYRRVSLLLKEVSGAKSAFGWAFCALVAWLRGCGELGTTPLLEEPAERGSLRWLRSREAASRNHGYVPIRGVAKGAEPARSRSTAETMVSRHARPGRCATSQGRPQPASCETRPPRSLRDQHRRPQPACKSLRRRTVVEEPRSGVSKPRLHPNPGGSQGRKTRPVPTHGRNHGFETRPAGRYATSTGALNQRPARHARPGRYATSTGALNQRVSRYAAARWLRSRAAASRNHGYIPIRGVAKGAKPARSRPTAETMVSRHAPQVATRPARAPSTSVLRDTPAPVATRPARAPSTSVLGGAPPPAYGFPRTTADRWSWGVPCRRRGSRPRGRRVRERAQSRRRNGGPPRLARPLERCLLAWPVRWAPRPTRTG